jgi:hypothetical protein
MKESIIIGSVLVILLFNGIFKSLSVSEEDKQEKRITKKAELTFNFTQLDKK